jgi:hypothetical protein
MVLVVYFNNSFPMRRAVRDHLFAFRRYLPVPVLYVNAARDRFARSAAFSERTRRACSLIVFHTTFLSAIRWDPSLYESRVPGVLPLRDWPAERTAFPQDEFYNVALLERFFGDAAVDHVFSAAVASEWPKIYPSVDRQSVALRQVLTGYIDEAAVRRVDRRYQRAAPREIAIGYRAWRAEPWLGRLGRLKADIAEVFRPFDAPGFRVDASTAPEDTLLGNAWLDFLLNCRSTLGTGSGASILDRDGSLRQQVREFQEQHPDAGYDQVEAACFPGRDGELDLNVIGPRHFEACATRTCQVLVRAPFNGILEPDRHYVPLEADFANAAEVAEKLRSEAYTRQIAEQAYDDVVRSGRWTYRAFIRDQVAPLVRDAGGTHRVSVAHRTRVRTEQQAVDTFLAARHSGPHWFARGLRRIGVPISPDAFTARLGRMRRAVTPGRR